MKHGYLNMKMRFYTELMLLVGMVSFAVPVSAHQLGHDAHTSSVGFWHNITHSLEACATQFAPSYLVVLFLLLSVLAFVAYKVKWGRS